MDIIQNIDQSLFNLINQDLSNIFFDKFLVFIRNKYVWLPLYLFLISFFIFNFKKKGIVIILIAFIAVGIADFTSAGIIKPSIERLRPCNDLSENPNIISRVNCGGGYSFPSSHASNHFALGIYFYLIFFSLSKVISYSFLIWAFMISFAQIYVGVHYPIDILAGILLGSLIGFLEFKFFKQIESRYFINRSD